MSPVVLTILIAWALLSVMFLTGTLLAARSIDRSVAVIKPNVDEIGTEAGFIDQARTIRNTSTKINKAAAPLTGHLKVTLRVADKGIDPKLKRILGKVGQINSVAGEINGTVLTIGSTVDQIYGSASSINTRVNSIGSKVRNINRSAQEINGSARSILSSGNSILSRVNSIDTAVTKNVISLASTIDNQAQAIKKDFIGIDANVGQQGRNGAFAAHINGHANSIDCAAVFNGALTPLLAPILGKKFGGARCQS